MLRAAPHLNDGLDGLRDSRAEMQPSGRGDEAGTLHDMAGRANRSGAVKAERHGHLCVHHNLPERTRSVRCNPAQQQGRARRPVKGSTTRQLPCRFMALGVNRRNSMAVEFGL